MMNNNKQRTLTRLIITLLFAIFGFIGGGAVLSVIIILFGESVFTYLIWFILTDLSVFFMGKKGWEVSGKNYLSLTNLTPLPVITVPYSKESANRRIRQHRLDYDSQNKGE